jgi:hypothetical protein
VPTFRQRVKPDAPHVERVSDPAAKLSLVEVWKRLQLIEANHDDLATAHDILSGTVTALSQAQSVLTASAQLQNARQARAAATVAPPPPPLDDGGQGELGCSSAGPNGHLPPGTILSLMVAGQIICGTSNEFPALLAVTIDQPTRDANRNELLDRMCWHMNLAGFPTGRYPTGAAADFDLLFDFQGSQYAYRVVSYDLFDSPMTTMMLFAGQTPGATTTVNGGTPD